MNWAAFDGTTIRLRQRKTKVTVVIPVGAPTRHHSGNRAWHGLDTIRLPRLVAKSVIKSGVTGLTFHDLRGTAVTRLAVAGATVPEIAEITGHSLKEAGSILDIHYTHRDPAPGQAAIRKLEERVISPN